jgi:copper chaperone CopZ
METKIKVTGMTCNHCVGAVTRALEGVPGVEQAEVSLETGQALVKGDAEISLLLNAIKEEGYEARPL